MIWERKALFKQRERCRILQLVGLTRVIPTSKLLKVTSLCVIRQETLHHPTQERDKSRLQSFKDKNAFYLTTQFVPRCKHLSPQLQKPVVDCYIGRTSMFSLRHIQILCELNVAFFNLKTSGTYTNR